MSQPLISVDVVPLRFRPRDGITVILGARAAEPHAGSLALPGVLLGHERLNEAVGRALAKIDALPQDGGGLAPVEVFDNPDRDPRGPTLSITYLVAVDQHFEPGGQVRALALDDPLLETLPFDHSTILTAAQAVARRALWSDLPLTRAFLGETFTTRDAADLSDLLDPSQRPVDRSNLARELSRNPSVRALGSVGEHRRGRPAGGWEWTS